ncbi:hypothetical protein [Candidatus Halobonum tyrrellensis]|uniref:Uncharacterized protein n=1 Tax=Candidatus Halobonum tyrrellensis G22 TaxID=1324957 RepID=V4IWW3_9EURY|nr:hypothetical protein [Candidatus Halobonum tyrrellensis]ESP87677.1 hypothetical protein K933_12690 [Candidatus Halobonum tyrrellensis G22]
MSRRRPAVGAVLLASLALLGAALARARRAAAAVPLSPLSAGGRVGADWPERAGVVTDEAPAGEMDDLTEFARPGFDPDRVAPAVRAFYERTGDYRMAYRARWHAPFRSGAALVSPLTSFLGQLNLPGRGGGGRLRSRFAAVTADADPREGARAWVRTRPDGTAVFVAAYAHHESGGERFVNVAVPLPGGNLSTVLRVDHLDADGDASDAERGETGGTGVRLHTDGDDPGLYLVTPLGAFALPVDQAFRVWPAGATGAYSVDAPDVSRLSDAAAGTDAGVVADHRMWLFGRRFLTVTYRAVPAGSAGAAPSDSDAPPGSDPDA